MLEYLKLFAEWAMKVAQEVPRRRAERRLSVIGADLYLFVTYMNEMLIQGGDLLEEVDRFRQYLLTGDPERYDLASLRTKFTDRARRIESIKLMMWRIGPELELIDPRSYNN